MWFDGAIGMFLRIFIPVSYTIFYGPWLIIASSLAKQAKHKNFIFISATILEILALTILCVGIIALVSEQSFYTWFPFTLIGGMWVIVMPFMYFIIMRAYKKAELDKMSVDDLT